MAHRKIIVDTDSSGLEQTLLTYFAKKVKKPSVRLEINQELRKFLTPYVPKRTSHLRRAVSVTSAGIKYNAPYAATTYRGLHEDGETPIKKWTTPGTHEYWATEIFSHRQEIDTIIKDALGENK